MDRRRSPRITTQLPVRIWGIDAHSTPFMQLATLTNISMGGAEVRGIRRQLQPGEILELQYCGEKAQFRVVWAGALGTQREGSIGLQVLPAKLVPWDVDLGQCSQLVARG